MNKKTPSKRPGSIAMLEMQQKMDEARLAPLKNARYAATVIDAATRRNPLEDFMAGKVPAGYSMN